MVTQPETEDIQSFERRSGTYEDSFLQGLFFDRIHRIALKLVPVGLQPESILDIGCGTGRLLRKAATRWPTARLTGVDPAEGMVREARRLTPQAVFHVSMVESLPLPDSSTDLVFSTTSFHHWQDQLQGIKQITRVLRPEGVFVLVDIVMPFGLGRIHPHGRQTSPATVRGMFAQAGLDVQTQRRAMSRFILVTVGRRAK
ncbi:MAG TPA: methyltransferase domain-containing protein [Terriglobia bacterium]|nr:methyltransferase domain-containing protein [Terriglobia bacterium]